MNTNKLIKAMILAPNKDYVLKIVNLLLDCHITNENIILAAILHEADLVLLTDIKIANIIKEC